MKKTRQLGERGPYGSWAPRGQTMVATSHVGSRSFVLQLLLDLSTLWFWLQLLRVGCLWASFAILFDPQCLKIFILCT